MLNRSIAAADPFGCLDRCGRACHGAAIWCAGDAWGMQECVVVIIIASVGVVISQSVVVIKCGNVGHGSNFFSARACAGC